MAVLIKGQSIKCTRQSRDHYLRGLDNERVIVREVSGFATKNAHEALQMIELSAKGTRCAKPLYSAKINPETDRGWTKQEALRAVNMLEKNLGLTGHARVVVEHLKHGRVHYHVLWNRFPPDGGPAKHMGGDYAAHQKTQREIEKEFKLKPMNAKGRDFKLWEVEYAARYGFDIFKLRDQITEDFNAIKSGQAFMDTLKAKGIVLCRGDKSQFVLVLPWGQHKALSSMIYGRPTKAVLRRALADIDIKSLPTVEEGKKLVKAMLPKALGKTEHRAFRKKVRRTAHNKGTQKGTQIQIAASFKRQSQPAPIVEAPASSSAQQPISIVPKLPVRTEREEKSAPQPMPYRPVAHGGMCKEQLADYIAACDGKITWAQYFQKWGDMTPTL